MGTNKDNRQETCKALQATESFWDKKAELSNGVTHLAVCEDDPWISRCIDRAQRPIVRKAIADIAGSLGDGERHVVDLGCGVGRWIRDLTVHFTHYDGVDISETMVKIAREKHPMHRFSIMKNLILDIEDEFVDLVMSIAVLHHNSYENQGKLLAEVSRVLRPNGELLLLESIGSPTNESVSVFYPRPSSGWIKIAEQNGFELVDKTGTAYHFLSDIMARIVGGRRWLETPFGRAWLWLDSFTTPLLSPLLPERFHVRTLLRFRKT